MKHHIIVAATAAMLGTPTTWATASTAAAEITNLKVQLIDLDASDGVAPAVAFQNYQGGTFVAAETGVSDAYGQFVRSTDIESGVQVFGGASASSAMGNSSASASFAGDAWGAGASVSTSTSSSGIGHYGASTVMLGDGGDYVSFTLSPHTRMVISADASTTAMSTIDNPYADARASAYLKLTDYTGQGAVSYGDAQSRQGSTDGAAPSASTDGEHLEVSFENLDSSIANGIFFGSVDASASDLIPISTVSEPGGRALVLAALGMMTWRGRRAAALRRRHS